MKTFTLDEAQALVPVLESLLKRAVEGKRSAESIEESLQELNRRIFVTGGLMVDVAKVRRQRSSMEQSVQQAKDSLAEIDAIGVQVKDLETGLLDFPCKVTMESGFRGRQPIDDRFSGNKSKQPRPERPN
jgi:hypothetical protein